MNLSKKHKSLVVILLVVILPAAAYFIFLNNNSKPEKEASKHIVGSWLRSDGPYTIKITEVLPDGKLDASYFNPKTINVGKAGWRIENEVLQVYVELQDENYPGSIYQLNFDENSGSLLGTYYQAVSRQTFEVMFNRKK